MKVSRLIELLQDFQRTYGDMGPVYAGSERVTDVVRTRDTNPQSDTEGTYYIGGVCMIERESNIPS